MSLGLILGDYLVAYEGHTENELELHVQLQSQIENSTMSELITQYNKLTVQKLWYQTVVDIFNDEFLRRAKESTFMISTTWDVDPQTQVVTKAPSVVHIQIGYEDSYLVLSPNGYPIPNTDSTIKSFSLLNESFTSEEETNIQGIILKGNVEVILQFQNGNYEIQSIGNSKDSLERVIIAPLGQQSPRVPVRIMDSDEFGLIRRALNGIRNGFTVIDYWPIDQPEIDELSEGEIEEQEEI